MSDEPNALLCCADQCLKMSYICITRRYSRTSEKEQERQKEDGRWSERNENDIFREKEHRIGISGTWNTNWFMDKYLVICTKRMSSNHSIELNFKYEFHLRHFFLFQWKTIWGDDTSARRLFRRISRSSCGQNNNSVYHKWSGSLSSFPIPCTTHVLVLIVINSMPFRNDDNIYMKKTKKS